MKLPAAFGRALSLFRNKRKPRVNDASVVCPHCQGLGEVVPEVP